MKLKERIYLALVCLTFVNLWTQGVAAPKKHDKEKSPHNNTRKHNVPSSASPHDKDKSLHNNARKQNVPRSASPHDKDKSLHNNARKQNVPRSALVAIHPEDLTLHPAKPKEVLGSRKSGLREVNLQTMEEGQVMNALSGKLSRLPVDEEKIIKDFLKDMERSHGELTPSVMKKMVRIGGYQPFQQSRSRAVNLQGTQRSLESNQKPVSLPFKLGANTDTFTNTETDLGEENPAYNIDPLPEYNYKELKYNLPTTVDNDYRSNDYSDNDLHGNDYHENDLHGNDYHANYFQTNDYHVKDLRDNDYHGNDLRGNDLHGNDHHGNDFNDGFHGNDLHISDDDYSKAFDQVNDNGFGTTPDGGEDGESRMAGIGSIVGRKGENLINEIGRKVLLNIIQKQNEEKTQKMSDKEVEVPDLLGAAENKNPAFTGETINSFPSQKGTVLPSSAQNGEGQENKSSNIGNSLADLFTSNRASQGITSGSATSGLTSQKIAQFLEHLGLTSTKMVTQEAQTPVENALNSKIPNDENANPSAVDRKIDISGKVNNVIDDARVTTPITTTPTSKATSVAMTTTVGRKFSTQKNNDNAANDDVVILKISGQGKPVSFKADTSTDGSLVLKIPKKYSEKIIQPNSNQATESKNDGADAHPGDLSADAIKLLAGKMGKSSLLSDQPQISDWEISGKQDKEKNDQNVMVDLHPTRNVLPTDKHLPLPSLSSLLQSQSETNHDPKTLVQAPQSVLPSTAGLTVQKELGNFDTPNNLIKSVFPNLVGLPAGAQNIEQLMTLLTRMDQLPSTQLGVTAYGGTTPTNYAVRQNVGENPASMKGVLKASELVEDAGVARNKGIKTEKDKNKETENDWSPCTVTCGQGIQARARPCQGRYCSGFATESRPCNAGPCPEQLAKSGFKLQNTFRGWHHSHALTWSSSLATKAQKLADDLALNNDSLMLSAELKELPGENIAVINQGYETAAETAARQWYGEVKGYSFTHPSIDDSTRHFTQVVWKGTKKAGIGLAKSKTSDNTYVVALYDPPGNMEGQQRKNVKMPDMSQA